MLDAIVVGSGPAGAAAALGLARRGHNVAVLDYRERIGDKLCTGIVGRQCFDTYDVPRSLVLHEARSATFITHDGARVRVERDDPQAYVIDRVAFVANLAEQAREAGAELLTGARVTGIEKRPESVDVSFTRHGESRQLRARSVIVASGAASKVARMAGLSPARQIAFASQAVATAGEALSETQVLLPGIAPQGHFGWIVPQGDGRALVGGMGRPRADHYGIAEAAAGHGLIASGPLEWKRWPVPVGHAERTVADRALLIGDAAGQVKPTTGGGIFYALTAADIAAGTLSDALLRDKLSAGALSAYDAAWKRALGRELRVGRIARSIYERLDGPSAKRLLKTAEASGLLKERSSFDWHADLIVRGLSYRMFDAALTPLRAVSGALSALV